MYSEIAKKKTPAGTKFIHSGTSVKVEEAREDLQEESIDEDESQSRRKDATRRPFVDEPKVDWSKISEDWHLDCKEEDEDSKQSADCQV